MSEKAKKSEEEFVFQCPACKKGNVQILKTYYDLPDGDKMLIIKFECNECNFSNNDIIPLTTNFEPGIRILKITNENDLKSKIYRSPIAKLEIPELELVVEPGPSASFYYTNVEGILDRFEQAVRIFKRELDKENSQNKKVDDILDDMAKAKKGEMEFTLKITDESGGSYIIPQDESKLIFKKFEDET
jgi:zinc finger protein